MKVMPGWCTTKSLDRKCLIKAKNFTEKYYTITHYFVLASKSYMKKSGITHSLVQLPLPLEPSPTDTQILLDETLL